LPGLTSLERDDPRLNVESYHAALPSRLAAEWSTTTNPRQQGLVLGRLGAKPRTTAMSHRSRRLRSISAIRGHSSTTVPFNRASVDSRCCWGACGNGPVRRSFLIPGSARIRTGSIHNPGSNRITCCVAAASQRVPGWSTTVSATSICLIALTCSQAFAPARFRPPGRVIIQVAGLPALKADEPGQVGNEAATVDPFKCRGSGSPNFGLKAMLQERPSGARASRRSP